MIEHDQGSSLVLLLMHQTKGGCLIKNVISSCLKKNLVNDFKNPR